jgi:hypothetical protein
METTFITQNGPATRPEKSSSLNPPPAPLIPVLGQKGSLTQIPQWIPATTSAPAVAAAGAGPGSHYLQTFEQLSSQCRELMRRRLYGLHKPGAQTQLESEAQGLPEEAFGADARQLFLSLATEVLAGHGALLTQLWLTDYLEVPPAMDQFLFDDHFLGQSLRPAEDNTGIWPGWSQLLCRDYDLDSEVHNAVLTGALGTGKTLMLVVILLYRLCTTTMLRNPQQFYGINRSSLLGFVLLSISRATVRDTAFSEALNLLAQSPYFVEVCGFDPRRQYADCRVEMKRLLPSGQTCRIVLTAGSQSQHMLGRNLLGVGLDEGNFRLEADPDFSAHQLYQAARSRMENRFRRMPGFLPTLGLIASSAADETSFTETVIRQIQDSGQTKTQKVHRFAAYHLQKPGQVLSSRWFKVCHGLANLEPYVLEGDYAQDGTRLGGGPHAAAPPGASVELVPHNYYEAFRRDPRTALQEFSGIAIGGSHRLFSSLVDLQRCLELSKAEHLLNPCFGQAESLSISRDDAPNIWDYIDPACFFIRSSSHNHPLRYPNHQRYAHVDLAQSSAAGLAICHLVAHKPVDTVSAMGESFTEMRFIVEYDLILRILPGSHNPISIDKIQNLFLKLRSDWGFNFGLITFDMYQSAMAMELLQANGFNTQRLSVDRDKTAYTAWRTAAQEHRLRFYPHQVLLTEMAHLVDCGRKFDHPPGAGTKDVADAVAGAYLNAISSEEKATLSTENRPSIYATHNEPMDYQQKLDFNFCDPNWFLSRPTRVFS